MKKLLSLILMLTAFMARAEFVKVAEFNDTYGTHEVGVLITEKTKLVAVDFDSSSDAQITLLYSFSQLDDLINFFKQVKAKYVEWSKVALDNHVTEITKRMPLEAPTAMAVWSDNDEVYATNDDVVISPLFSNDGDSGTKFHVFNAISIADSDDSSVTNTVHLNFANAMQIQGLINALNPQRLRNAANGRDRTVDQLFK